MFLVCFLFRFRESPQLIMRKWLELVRKSFYVYVMKANKTSFLQKKCIMSFAFITWTYSPFLTGLFFLSISVVTTVSDTAPEVKSGAEQCFHWKENKKVFFLYQDKQLTEKLPLTGISFDCQIVSKWQLSWNIASSPRRIAI